MPRAGAQSADPLAGRTAAPQVSLERLESCVRRLDPAERALLDLSLNRGMTDAAMAPIVRTDPMRLAWRRARAIERVASRMGLQDPASIADVRTALTRLPDRAWLPLELQPAPEPRLLQAGEDTELPAPLLPPEPEDETPEVYDTREVPPIEPAEPATPEHGFAVRSHVLAVRSTNEWPAASLIIGGLTERAKRAYPREAMTTQANHGKRARAVVRAVALAGVGALLGAALRRRR